MIDPEDPNNAPLNADAIEGRRLASEIQKAVLELESLHPAGSREAHLDAIHADRLKEILNPS